MRLGLTLPHYDYSFDSQKSVTFDDVATVANVAESIGFDALYVSDHVSLDIAKYGGPKEPFHSLDPMSVLAGLAPITNDVTLGTLVLCEALRHPVMTASIAHTLQEMSAGRFVLGLGAGWYDPDYEIYGNDMPPIGERMTRLTETLRIVTALFEGNVVDSDGEFYSSHGSHLTSPLTPASAQSERVPVFLGGKGDRLLRMVARYCDGWNTCWAWTPQAYRERVDSLHRACEKYERDPASVYQSLGLYSVVADSETELKELFADICALSPEGVADGKTLESWREGKLVGTTEEVAHQMREWSELGVREIIVNPGFAPFHIGSTEIIERIGASLTKARVMADA